MIDDILISTTKKLILLDSIEDWNNELLSKAPPVLWFGNSKSSKEKIVTFGANPSRWEFLRRGCPQPFKKQCYETKYLANSRFKHLNPSHSYEDIISDKDLRDAIIMSYDNYFQNGNQYKEWFGDNTIEPYRVEGVLRGMNASYYERN